MPRASAAAAAETSRQVLDVATEMFSSRGYSAVSLDDVATASGVTRGAVYHHYGSKAGLFRAVAARLQSSVAESVVAAAESQGDNPRDQLSTGCHAFIDAITQGPAVRVLLIDAPAVFGWAEWRALDATNSEVHLREALTAVGTENDLLDAMTAQLSGAMNEGALWIAQHPDCASRQAAHDALDKLLSAFQQ